MSEVHAFNHKMIGFIQAKRDKFQAKIGICYDSEGDNDCFVSVTHAQNPTTSLDEAREQLNSAKIDVSELETVYLNPIPVQSDGILWLSVIQAAQ